MVRKGADVMYDDLINHLVLVKARGIVAPNEWSCALDYVQW